MKKNILIGTFLLIFLLSGIASASRIRGRTEHGVETELWVDDYSTLPENPQTGFSGVILQVDFHHTGSATYRNISFEAQTPDQLEPVRERFYISSMSPRDIYTTTYRFNVKEDTEPGIYTVPIEITYTDIQGKGDGKITIQREARLRISDETRIEIIEVNQEEPVEQGEEFKTELKVKNIGNIPSNLLKASLDIRETQEQSLTAEGQPKAKEEAISWKRQQKTVDYLQPGEIRTIEFQGTTSISAENKIYPAIATVESGENVESNKFIVTIAGKPEIIEAGITTAGENPRKEERTPISIQLENIGKGDAKAVKLELEEGAYKGVRKSHIGTIDEDGGTGTAVMDLTFQEAGKHNLKYTVTYQDVTGEKYTQTFTGTLYIDPETKDYTYYIAGAIILLIAIYLTWRKIKRNRETEEMEI